jgi:hypothetical protein
MAEKCQIIKPDGNCCKANALPGNPHCFAHDAGSVAKRQAARSAGGKARSRPRETLPDDVPDLTLSSVKDVTSALGKLTNLLPKGKLDVKVTNGAAYLLSTMLKTVEVGELEERVAEPERRGKVAS